MLKSSVRPCIAALLAGWSLLAGAVPETDASPQERSAIETCLGSLPPRTQVAIALLRGNERRFLGAEKTPEGIRYLDNRQRAFQIGSITKVFTATLFAQQVKKGALGLEDPVQQHLPFRLKVSGQDGAAMTLKQLASHTSGIGHHQPPGLMTHAFFHGHTGEPWKDYDQGRFDGYLKQDLALASRPGSRYFYSNLGMSLLGRILCLRTSRTYEAMLQEDLFGPLGMRTSTTEITRIRDRLVEGLDARGKPMPNQDMNALAPCGGLFTTAEDLAIFLRAQFEPADAAITLTQVPVFTIEEGYRVALGWHLVDWKQGWRMLNHNGGIGGYTASLFVDSKNHCAALVLSNITNDEVPGEKVRQLCRDLIRGLESKP